MTTMDLSRRDVFRPCSRASGDKDQYFVLLAEENCNWNRQARGQKFRQIRNGDCVWGSGGKAPRGTGV